MSQQNFQLGQFDAFPRATSRRSSKVSVVEVTPQTPQVTPQVSRRRSSVAEVIREDNSKRCSSNPPNLSDAPNEWVTRMATMRHDRSTPDPFLRTMTSMSGTGSIKDRSTSTETTRRMYLQRPRLRPIAAASDPTAVGSFNCRPSCVNVGLIPRKGLPRSKSRAEGRTSSKEPTSPSWSERQSPATPLPVTKGDFLPPLLALFRGPRAERPHSLVHERCTKTCSSCSLVANDIRAFESNQERLLYERPRQSNELTARRELEKFYSAKVLQVMRFATEGSGSPSLATLFEGLSAVQLEELFIHCVGSIHGSLSFEAFRTMMMQLVGMQFAAALTEDVLQRMFDLFDDDRSGRLDFVEYMSTLSVSLQPPELSAFVGNIFFALDTKNAKFIRKKVFNDTPLVMKVFADLQATRAMVAQGAEFEKQLLTSLISTVEDLHEEDQIAIGQFRVLVWTTPGLLNAMSRAAFGDGRGMKMMSLRKRGSRAGFV